MKVLSPIMTKLNVMVLKSPKDFYGNGVWPLATLVLEVGDISILFVCLFEVGSHHIV